MIKDLILELMDRLGDSMLYMDDSSHEAVEARDRYKRLMVCLTAIQPGWDGTYLGRDTGFKF